MEDKINRIFNIFKRNGSSLNNSEQIINKYLTRGQLPNVDIRWKSALNEKVSLEQFDKSLIDFTSGILVTNLGHSNKKIKKKIKECLNSNFLYNYHYYSLPKAKYLETLSLFFKDIFVEPKFYLTTSGTEACETAIKLMLKSGLKENNKKNKILSINGNYHGRTAGAALMGPDNFFKKAWENIDNYFPKIDFPYKWDVNEEYGKMFFYSQIEKINNNEENKIAGIILESFQGWGVCVYPKSFVQAIREYCNKNKIILTFDEMQSGFYRGGERFFLEHYEVQPDLICMGKGMGGGFPMSGVAGKKEIMDNVQRGELSSTHAANPIGCIVGKEILDIMSSKNFLDNLRRNSLIFCEEGFNISRKYELTSKKSNFIGMVGAIVIDDKNEGTNFSNVLFEKCLEKGLLLIKTGRESVKLAPPLNIKQNNIRKAFKIIDQSLSEIFVN